MDRLARLGQGPLAFPIERMTTWRTPVGTWPTAAGRRSRRLARLRGSRDVRRREVGSLRESPTRPVHQGTCTPSGSGSGAALAAGRLGCGSKGSHASAFAGVGGDADDRVRGDGGVLQRRARLRRALVANRTSQCWTFPTVRRSRFSDRPAGSTSTSRTLWPGFWYPTSPTRSGSCERPASRLCCRCRAARRGLGCTFAPPTGSFMSSQRTAVPEVGPRPKAVHDRGSRRLGSGCTTSQEYALASSRTGRPTTSRGPRRPG